MELWAKIRLIGEQDAGNLVRAFFKEFDPESSIMIKGNEAKLNIVFKEPPQKIVDAICCCEIVECNYGKNLEEPLKVAELSTVSVDKEETPEVSVTTVDEKVAPEVSATTASEQGISEVIETPVVKQEVVEESSVPVIKKEISEKTKKSVVKQRKTRKSMVKHVATRKAVNQNAEIEIPELIEIAQNAISFDNFVDLVGEWLGTDKKHKYFTSIIYAASQVERITWNHIKGAFFDNGWRYSDYYKIVCTECIDSRLKNVTILTFIKEVVKYKDYNFGSNEKNDVVNESVHITTDAMPREEEVTSSTEVVPVEEVPVSFEEVVTVEEECIPKETTYKNKAKMNCMPSIPSFEEVLGSVDKTQSIEERVIYVLNAMGLEKKSPDEQQFIFTMVNAGVRQKRVAYDIIFIKAYIDMKDSQKARMTLSEFINAFVKENGFSDKIKVLTFLKELQKLIMFDHELEDFEDFSN